MTRLGDDLLDRLERFLETRPAISIDLPGHRPAAVIVPLIKTDSGLSVLFCQRSEDLSLHSGQIAFPGGGADPGETMEATALRETEEEIGLPRGQVQLIGRLDDLTTISGYVVAPFVGIIPSGFDYVLQTSEIVKAFEVPLEHLLSPSNLEVRYIAFRGTDYPSCFFHFDGIEIWGLTATILKELLDAVRTVS